MLRTIQAPVIALVFRKNYSSTVSSCPPRGLFFLFLFFLRHIDPTSSLQRPSIQLLLQHTFVTSETEKEKRWKCGGSERKTKEMWWS